MIRTINIIGNPILGVIAKDVEFDKDENPMLDAMTETDLIKWPEWFRNFVQDLKDTLSATNGVGLAANQIWEKEDEAPPKVFVIMGINKATNQKQLYEYINPKIKISGGTYKSTEGCLSVPDYIRYNVPRKKKVTIEFQTLNTVTPITAQYTFKEHSYIPFIIQHEYDHLMGKLIK